MRPSLGYSNLYWSNRDRKRLEKKKIEQETEEKTLDLSEDTESVFQEFLSGKSVETIVEEEEEKLPPPTPTHFPIARIDK